MHFQFESSNPAIYESASCAIRELIGTGEYRGRAVFFDDGFAVFPYWSYYTDTDVLLRAKPRGIRQLLVLGKTRNDVYNQLLRFGVVADPVANIEMVRG